MKKIGFIGGADKTNLIIYIAKVLEDLNKKVIVADTTLMQKTKYVVPALDPTKSYITDYQNVDYAIGFESISDIGQYLGLKNINSTETWPYDYMIIDIDSASAIENFEIEDGLDNYFVTTFDIYSLKRGMEILKKLPSTMTMSKILMNYNIKKDDEEYLLYLSADTKAIWNDFSLYIPILDENEQLMEENQRVYRPRLKKLIPEYQEGIIYIVQNIIKEQSVSRIRKMIKE